MRRVLVLAVPLFALVACGGSPPRSGSPSSTVGGTSGAGGQSGSPAGSGGAAPTAPGATTSSGATASGGTSGESTTGAVGGVSTSSGSTGSMTSGTSGASSTGTAPGGACSADSQCAGAAAGQALCVNWGAAQGGATCAPTCQGDADCQSGCCLALTDGSRVCAVATYCGSTPAGSACTASYQCQGANTGRATCVNFGGSVGEVCEAVCQADADCGTGCCIGLTDGTHACAPASQCAPPAGDDGAKQVSFFDKGSDTDSYTLLMDASGTKHLAYATTDNGGQVIYGECSSSCEQFTSWTFSAIASTGAGGGHPHLALDPSGRPRIVFMTANDNPTWDQPGNFSYAECNGGCTSPGSWAVTEVVRGDSGTPLDTSGSRYFNIDAHGHASFVLGTHTGLYYASCSGNCTQAASWNLLRLTQLDPSEGRFSLQTTSSGSPRLVYRGLMLTACNGDDGLIYMQCDQNCATDASQWTHLILSCRTNLGPFDLAIASNDTPRLAYYDGNSYRTQYWFCNGSCTTAGSWYYNDVGLGNWEGEAALYLALDPQDRPRMTTIGNTASHLNYAECTSSCESSATWTQRSLDSIDAIAQSDPLPPPPGSETEFWNIAGPPSFVTNFDGSISVAYGAYWTLWDSVNQWETNSPTSLRYGHF